VFFNILAARL